MLALFVFAKIATPAYAMFNVSAAQLDAMAFHAPLGQLPRHCSGQWCVQVEDSHCMLANTLHYESFEVRWAAAYAEQWFLNHGSGTFVDIGANCGLFSMIMAALRHDVMAFEPLPTCVSDIELGRKQSGFGAGSTFAVQQRGISDRNATFPVPANLCSPYFQVGQAKYRAKGKLHDLDTHSGVSEASSLALDEAVARRHRQKPIFLTKMDTEGHEVPVIRSGTRLFKRHTIKTMMWELSPSKWRFANVSKEEGLQVLADVIDGSGYVSAVYVDDRKGYPPACRRDHRLCKTSDSLPTWVTQQLNAADEHMKALEGKGKNRAKWGILPLGVAAFANATFEAVAAGLDSPDLGRNVLSIAPPRAELPNANLAHRGYER